MLETFDSAYSRDFRQRFLNSFGFFINKATTKKTLVLMTAVGDNTTTFIDAKETIYTAHADEGNVFEFIPITKKLFVLNDRLMYIQRRPARMWSRGINSANTQLSDLTRGREEENLTFASVVAALGNERGLVSQKVIDLEQKKINSVALSDLFGVSQTTLYLYDKPIGSFVPDSRAVICDDKMFKQELDDLVKRLGISYQVTEKA